MQGLQDVDSSPLDGLDEPRAIESVDRLSDTSAALFLIINSTGFALHGNRTNLRNTQGALSKLVIPADKVSQPGLHIAEIEHHEPTEFHVGEEHYLRDILRPL
ncbi:unnamed protein product [Diplocarpon coronariae]